MCLEIYRLWRALKCQVKGSEHYRSKRKISFKYVAKTHPQKWKLSCIELELSPFRLVKIRKFKDTLQEMVWERALSYTDGGNQPGWPLEGTLSRAQAHISFDLITIVQF